MKHIERLEIRCWQTKNGKRRMKRCRVAIHTLQKKDNVLKSIETRCVRPAACKWDRLKDGRCFCF